MFFDKQLLSRKEYILLDVRTPSEFSEKHLSGAVNIDYNSSEFEKNIQSLDNSKPIFLYCKSGRRSGSSVEILEKYGFKEFQE